VESLAQLSPMPTVNPGRMRPLTKRERDVVRLLAEGLINRDIARELNLREHTIKNYLFRMFDKAGVPNRVELVLYAVNSVQSVQVAEHQKDTLVSEDSSAGELSTAGPQ